MHCGNPVALTWAVFVTVFGILSPQMNSRAIAAPMPSINKAEQQAFQKAAAIVAPSVVRIETLGAAESADGVLLGAGPTTGVIVSSDGYIISSAINFAQPPGSILVYLAGGQRLPAKLVAEDRSRSLVLLKVNAKESLIVPTAAPAGQAAVGQWAIAVGRTYDLERPSVSIGVVSASARVWGRAVQTDAKISPSNYGGPLIDVRGRVLGILAPLSPEGAGDAAGVEWYDSGIGFAVPWDHVMQALPRLKKGETLQPGLLGISLRGNDLYGEPAVIAAAYPKSPAHTAGLRAGDVVIEVAGNAVTRQAQLKQAAGPKYAGDRLQLRIRRGTQELSKELTLAATLPPFEQPWLGILPQRTDQAIVVRHLFPGSPAEAAGLTVGDRLLKIDDTATPNRQAVIESLAQHTPGETVDVIYSRADRTLTAKLMFGAVTGKILDVAPAVSGGQNSAGAKTGRIEVKLPEFENQAIAYVPASYDPALPSGLLVWLHPAGVLNDEELLRRWRAHCDARNLILLAPKSADPTRWDRTEASFVRKAMDNISSLYKVDPARVVVHGAAGGGALAWSVAVQHRDIVRGLAVVEAAPPAGLTLPPTDPVQRLSVYSAIAADSALVPQVKTAVKRLLEFKYPVSVRDLPAGQRYLDDRQVDELARWVDSLDQL